MLYSIRNSLFALLFFLMMQIEADTIKILIAKDVPEILLEAKGRFSLLEMPQQQEISSGSRSKRQVLKLTPKGLQWGEYYQGVFHLKVRPGDSHSSILVNGIEYTGDISIYGMNQKIYVVNELDIEDFLKSSIQASIETPLLPEVLRAISVVMRTNAYYYMILHEEKAWHLDAETTPFMGSFLLKQKNEIVSAIDATSLEFLTFQSKPFASGFTEDCAGKTVSFSKIFQKESLSPPGIIIPFQEKEKTSRWHFSIEKHKLQKILSLIDIEKIERHLEEESGKVYALELVDKTPVAKTIDFLTLQSLLGKDKLLSNDFECKIKGDNIIFEGEGKGLGIGICLKAAKKLAEQKASYQEILQFFYPSTTLDTLKNITP